MSVTADKFSPAALELFEARGINPGVALGHGFTDEAGCLVAPNGRRRPLNGNGKSKWLQPKGKRLEPLALVSSEEGGTVIVTESETDGLALATAIPMLRPNGLGDPGVIAAPGTPTPPERLREALEEMRAKTVILAFDADEAGRRYTEKVAPVLTAAGFRVLVLPLPDGADLAELLAAADDPGRKLAELLDGAGEPSLNTPPDNRATAQPPVDREAEWRRCAALATEARILDRLVAELNPAGLVGEDQLAQLVYVATTSRLLTKPVSVAVKGPSAGGKSRSVEVVLGFFPSDAYYALTAMSERALAYSQEPLEHRMFVVYEAAGLESDFASYLMRSLLSEGKVRYETVEKTKNGMQAKLVERRGPTGLIVTTTKVRLHPENETRLLSLTVKDTAEQTKAIMRAIAEEDLPELDLRPWHALQRWLEPLPVSVPYAKNLAELIPAVAVRLRRDFGAVLGLVRAHALLHQATRERGEGGEVIATIEDYAIVRELVADLVATGVGAGVSDETRETVAAVAELGEGEPDGISQKALAEELGLDKSAVSRRVRVTLREGYLRNLEERRGHPSRLIVGDPLPDEQEILPRPEALDGSCTVARLKEGI